MEAGPEWGPSTEWPCWAQLLTLGLYLLGSSSFQELEEGRGVRIAPAWKETWPTPHPTPASGLRWPTSYSWALLSGGWRKTAPLAASVWGFFSVMTWGSSPESAVLGRGHTLRAVAASLWLVCALHVSTHLIPTMLYEMGIIFSPTSQLGKSGHKIS